MMSLYKMILGKNRCDILLACLGFKINDIPRFRNCYALEGKIVIYTRTGGGNRQTYENKEMRLKTFKEWGDEDYEGCEYHGPFNDDLRKNPHYLSDYDNDYDETYAYFNFKYPDEYKSDLEAIEKEIDGFSPTEKFKILIDKNR